MTAPEPPPELAAVRADDEVVEMIRSGRLDGDDVHALLTWRRDVLRGPGDPPAAGSALAGLDAEIAAARYGDPAHNPIAFLPVDEPAPPREFSHGDGSTYTRVSAVEFPSGDDLDSTAIVDDGAPE